MQQVYSCVYMKGKLNYDMSQHQTREKKHLYLTKINHFTFYTQVYL